ncbi:MAG: 30S ribosomal protein S5 alanine N-acetyltransferase, partial [Alphaproteobacteria bacterium]|nr:30S ribosomal protein S5 alanine N-acetyltransferase [Alphaproteobacteria bacterium]
MIFARRKQVAIETNRMTLRLPKAADHAEWVRLRQVSAGFLKPWEPTWSRDHLSRKSFSTRVYAAQRSVLSGAGMPLFLIRRTDRRLLGAIT